MLVNKDVYFIFMNIEPFADHTQIIFLPGNSDISYKARFVSTCDAMLHARHDGESFGLACGEFSIMNKPIVAFAHPAYGSHLQILGDKAIKYADEESLFAILNNFKNYLKFDTYDCYSDKFSPAPVMDKFNKVFLGGT
jgi:glutamine amidotransferase-like uncharacterized protein